MKASNRVAFNTIVLYGKMLITILITLYSVRLVLNGLGASDYGIYNLVAGVILLMSFLNSAMTASTQRYLSFHEGARNAEAQRKVFYNSLVLHVIVGLFIVAVLEILGFFLFEGFLNIPANRVDSARLIYHFMSATVFFTVLSVPYTASLNAHENMLTMSVVQIIETILKLLVAVSLFFINSDKLVFYGLAMAMISVASFLMYAVYCHKRYPECKSLTRNTADRGLLKELTSFAGWNLFGALCYMGRSQGLAILLNLFLGTVVNAAYAIANQVSGQLKFFSNAMLSALNPQIMKSEGANDRKRMLRLSMMASKFGFFLLAFVAIPCIFEMSSILTFWLKSVPDYTVIFCQLILAGSLTNQLTVGLQSASQAAGNIKAYQAIVGIILLLNLPVAYFLLKAGFTAYSILISFVVIEFIGCCFRLFLLKRQAGLSIKEYCRRVFAKELIPVAAVVATCFFMTSYFSFNYRFIVTIAVAVPVFMAAIYVSGLCKDEKDLVDKALAKAFSRVYPLKTIINKN
ncbi:MAG: hypothetical protein KF862_21995 [Chitinophagaceae bacterium]|nr:hypothetical protein [Chitinophagaceae bacterium]